MKRIAGFLLVLSTLMVSSAAYATTYIIETLTCNLDDADVDDSQVYLSLYGTANQFSYFQLDNSDRDDLERNAIDAFQLHTFDLGDLTSAVVELVGDDGWCFEWIAINDTSTGRVWTFYYGTWLDGDSRAPQLVVCTPESEFSGFCSAVR